MHYYYSVIYSKSFIFLSLNFKNIPIHLQCYILRNLFSFERYQMIKNTIYAIYFTRLGTFSKKSNQVQLLLVKKSRYVRRPSVWPTENQNHERIKAQ